MTETKAAGNVVVSEQLGISMSSEETTALDTEAGWWMVDGGGWRVLSACRRKLNHPLLPDATTPF